MESKRVSTLISNVRTIIHDTPQRAFVSADEGNQNTTFTNRQILDYLNIAASDLKLDGQNIRNQVTVQYTIEDGITDYQLPADYLSYVKLWRFDEYGDEVLIEPANAGQILDNSAEHALVVNDDNQLIMRFNNYDAAVVIYMTYNADNVTFTGYNAAVNLPLLAQAYIVNKAAISLLAIAPQEAVNMNILIAETQSLLGQWRTIAQRPGDTRFITAAENSGFYSELEYKRRRL